MTLTGATVATQVAGSVEAPAFPSAVEVREGPRSVPPPSEGAADEMSKEPDASRTPPPQQLESEPEVSAPEPEPSATQAQPSVEAGVSQPDAGGPDASASGQADAEAAQQPVDYYSPYPFVIPIPAGPPPESPAAPAPTSSGGTESSSQTNPNPARTPPRYELGPPLQGYTSPPLVPPGAYTPTSRYPAGR